MTRKALDMTRQIIKRGTRALKKADSSVTDVAPVSTENSGYFSFQYSYREISTHGSVARVRGRDTRFENGKLSSEAFEGNIDRQQFDRMLVQAQGAFGLSLLGTEARPAVAALASKLRSPDSLVRQNAALALGKIGPDAAEAVPALVAALHDTEWSVRRQAALALGEIGPGAKAAVPALQQINADSNHLVRRAALDALAKIKK